MLWSGFIRAHQPELSGTLLAHDFSEPLAITLNEGTSSARFDSGFARREGAEGEWLVAYTEHCGYPVFPFAAVTAIVGEQRDAERWSTPPGAARAAA
jgi:hypothetical protein